MKRIIILLFAFSTTLSAYGQTDILLQEAQQCFDAGNYLCAKDKYQEALNISNEKDKQDIEVGLQRAKNCSEWLKIANDAFNNKEYDVARENYNKIVAGNPKDKYAKEQLKMCIRELVPLTLSVDKTDIMFLSLEESEKISVTTNAESYTVDDLPSWCKVTKQSDSLTVTCEPNPSTERRNGRFIITAEDKTVRVNVSQAGKVINLSLSLQKLSFDNEGGEKTIVVTTNADSYTVETVENSSSWLTITKQSDSLTVKCTSNSGDLKREASFTVTAEDKTVEVNVSQAAKPIDVTVFPQNLFFKTKGGKKTVKINTNAQKYQITSLPDWCTVTKYADKFVVNCDANYIYDRTGSFKVTAGDKIIPVNINQSSEPEKCFNCPNTKYKWGISLGVVTKMPDSPGSTEEEDDVLFESNDYLGGIQAGLRFEPLFKYGFGLNTGLYYEYYSDILNQISDYGDDEDNTESPYEEHAIILPLHLEYRFNFSKYFNIFVYGGAGLEATITSSFSDDLKWRTSLEYGGGLRIKHVQLNIGQSSYIKSQNSGMENNKYMISLSYMF
jgi:hypothetical protein